MKFLKFLIGILLLPLCIVLSRTLWGLLEAAARPMSSSMLLPPPALALLAGFLFWTALFTVFPRPVRTYIFAHEFTHALWGVLMGASVSRFNVRKDRGSVVLSKTNFLITLAPYFFPLYTVLVIGVYHLLRVFYAVERFHLLWLGLVGATWAFHVTFTISALLQRQSDIREQGRLFSYTVIYLANVAGVCAWVMLVSGIPLRESATLVTGHTLRTWNMMVSAADAMAPFLRRVLERP